MQSPAFPDPPLGTAQSTLGSFSDDFFSTRWEPAPPVAMPNVRIPTTACPALADEEVDKLTKLAAGKNAIPRCLIRAVMKQESAFHPCAVSTAGAMGLMQIMPGTAETLGLEDAFSPGENVEAGARYLKQLLDRYHGDRRLASWRLQRRSGSRRQRRRHSGYSRDHRLRLAHPGRSSGRRGCIIAGETRQRPSSASAPHRTPLRR